MASNVGKPSHNGRNFNQIMEDFRQKTLSFQNPGDFLVHLGYIVNLIAPIRICVEAGIFRTLVASSSPLSSLDLAKEFASLSGPDAEEKLADREEYIGRMLRAVAALNLVDETGPSKFQANEITSTIAEDGFDMGFRELYDNAIGPRSTLSAMTDWGRDNSYTAPERGTDGPFQRARGIVGTNTFEHWVKDDPASLSNLSALMKIIQRDRLNWSEWFPAETLFDGTEGHDDRIFLVDVGGGWGHDTSALAGRYPDKKVRFVVEDLPSVIAETRGEKLDPRVELVEHDFFTKQPIRNAKIYFMHKIMHDWPDADCVDILTHLRDAMAPDSRIFINDAILLDQGNPLL